MNKVTAQELIIGYTRETKDIDRQGRINVHAQKGNQK